MMATYINLLQNIATFSAPNFGYSVSSGYRRMRTLGNSGSYMRTREALLYPSVPH